MIENWLYPVWRCRACGALIGDLNFLETEVLATFSEFYDPDFREDDNIRQEIREAHGLRKVSQHQCANGMIGITDFVGWSNHPISTPAESDERPQEAADDQT
jgi:hypothetical protein